MCNDPPSSRSQNFIQEIRACQNKEQEQKRVDKELAKIREKFGDDKNLDGRDTKGRGDHRQGDPCFRQTQCHPRMHAGYDKRKYVWKLLYIYMLGYEINFGHKQACDLIPKPKCVRARGRMGGWRSQGSATGMHGSHARMAHDARLHARMQVQGQAGRLHGVLHPHA